MDLFGQDPEPVVRVKVSKARDQAWCGARLGEIVSGSSLPSGLEIPPHVGAKEWVIQSRSSIVLAFKELPKYTS